MFTGGLIKLHDNIYNMYRYYYFDNDGYMVTGWQKANGKWYYFETDNYYSYYGSAKTGEYEINGVTYYFADDGHMITNSIYNAGAKIYYIDANGKVVSTKILPKSGWVELNGNWMYVKDAKLLVSQWLSLGGKWYYFDSNGFMVKNTTFYIYNAKINDSEEFHFDTNGYLITGSYYDFATNKTYFFGSDGRKYNGEYKNGTNTYLYLDGEVPKNDSCVYSNTLYKIDRNGKVLSKFAATIKGWKQINSDWYYTDGKQFFKNKMFSDSKYSYYLDSNYKMLKSKTNIEINDISGKAIKVSIDKDGHVIKSNWSYSYESPWKCYYSDKNGKIVTNSWQTISKATYYFDNNGEMATDIKYVNGVYQLFSENGSYLSKATFTPGWNIRAGHYYYVENSRPVIGWKKIGTIYYYFNNDGSMVSGQIKEIGNKTYSFNNKGALVTSAWVKLNIFGYYSWADQNGAFVTGWKNIGGKWYYFDSDMILCTEDTILNGSIQIIDASGVFKNAVSISKANGWYKIDGFYSYYKNGKKLDGWQKIDNKQYYFDAGMMTCDEAKLINNKFYYFNPDGTWVSKTGWVYDKSCYVKDGVAVQGWQQIDGKWYYIDFFKYQDCITKLKGIYYHFDKNGVEVGVYNPKDGWQQVDGKWYYGVGGELQDDCIKIGSIYYGFSGYYTLYSNCTDKTNDVIYGAGGGVIKNQWIRINGSWYYANCLGRMYMNETRVISGKTYSFDAEGRML